MWGRGGASTCLLLSGQNSVRIPRTWRINQPAVAASFYLGKQSQVAMGTSLYGWLMQTIYTASFYLQKQSQVAMGTSLYGWLMQTIYTASFYLQKQSQVAMGTLLYGWLMQTICNQEKRHIASFLCNTHHLQNSKSFQSDNSFTACSFNEMINLHSFISIHEDATLSRLTFIHNSLEHNLLN